MESIDIHQAKANFSRLLSCVELGGEIVISNRGTLVAKTIPFWASSNRRANLGQDRGRFMVPDDFNSPLPEDILMEFEGGPA